MLFCNIDIMDENLDHQKGMFVGVEGATITYVGKRSRKTQPSTASATTARASC